MKAQVGLGQGGRQRLAGFELEDLVGQVVRGPCVRRGEAGLWQAAGDGLAIKHGQKGSLADTTVAEDANALRPAHSLSQRSDGGFASEHGNLPRSARKSMVSLLL